MKPKIRFAHLLNPVKKAETSELYRAQKITFQTLRPAAEQAHAAASVQWLAACYPEDQDFLPAFLPNPTLLERDVTQQYDFQKKIKLPLLADILKMGKSCQEVDYFVFSNIDIALQPNFYLFLAQTIQQQKLDAFIINRRTIDKNHTNLNEMQADAGQPHQGFDCFVFRQNLLNQLFLGAVCVGSDWVGRALALNLVCLAPAFYLFENEKLTFHLGDDKNWKDPLLADYEAFNRSEMTKIVRHFNDLGLIENKFLSLKIARQLVKTNQKMGVEDGLSFLLKPNAKPTFWSRLKKTWLRR